jgi:hypothetical protein
VRPFIQGLIALNVTEKLFEDRDGVHGGRLSGNRSLGVSSLVELDSEVKSCSWNCLGDEVRSRMRCGPSRFETDERSS